MDLLLMRHCIRISFCSNYFPVSWINKLSLGPCLFCPWIHCIVVRCRSLLNRFISVKGRSFWFKNYVAYELLIFHQWMIQIQRRSVWFHKIKYLFAVCATFQLNFSNQNNFLIFEIHFPCETGKVQSTGAYIITNRWRHRRNNTISIQRVHFEISFKYLFTHSSTCH